MHNDKETPIKNERNTQDMLWLFHNIQGNDSSFLWPQQFLTFPISSANALTGFYMMGTLVVKRLKEKIRTLSYDSTE